MARIYQISFSVGKEPRRRFMCSWMWSKSSSRDGGCPGTSPWGCRESAGTEPPSTRMNPSSLGKMLEGSNKYIRISLQCDGDGWILKVNKEADYPHFFHVFPPEDILTVNVEGDVQLSYIGFGSKGELATWGSNLCLADLEPAPPVSFNLTFLCPEGEVGGGSQFVGLSPGVWPRLVRRPLRDDDMPGQWGLWWSSLGRLQMCSA